MLSVIESNFLADSLCDRFFLTLLGFFGLFGRSWSICSGFEEALTKTPSGISKKVPEG